MKCINCTHWSLRKGPPNLARLGLGHCGRHSKGPWDTFPATFERDCQQFNQATQETVIGRTEWLQKHDSNR